MIGLDERQLCSTAKEFSHDATTNTCGHNVFASYFSLSIMNRKAYLAPAVLIQECCYIVPITRGQMSTTPLYHP